MTCTEAQHLGQNLAEIPRFLSSQDHSSSAAPLLQCQGPGWSSMRAGGSRGHSWGRPVCSQEQPPFPSPPQSLLTEVPINVTTQCDLGQGLYCNFRAGCFRTTGPVSRAPGGGGPGCRVRARGRAREGEQRGRRTSRKAGTWRLGGQATQGHPASHGSCHLQNYPADLRSKT